MKTRFTEVKYGIALFTEIETAAIKSKSKVSRSIDACSWKTIEEAYPGFKVVESYQDWKNATLMGIDFALKLLGRKTEIEISLLDINGHDCHSNIYSMFMAGALSVFNEVGLIINNEGIEKIKETAQIYKQNQNFSPVLSGGMSIEEFRTKYLFKK